MFYGVSNKRIIDPIVPRHFAISNTNKVSAVIKGGQGEAYVESLPAHKKNPEVGSKKVTYSPTIYIEQSDATSFDVDEEVELNRLDLMDWLQGLNWSYILAGDFKKTKKKVHWLTTDEAGSTPSGAGLQNVVLLDYDYLITKRKIEDDDEIDDFITPVSEFREDAIADGNIRTMKERGNLANLSGRVIISLISPLGEDTTLATGSGKDWIELIKNFLMDELLVLPVKPPLRVLLLRKPTKKSQRNRKLWQETLRI
ncbi:hypothetical protein PGT21_035445 [Puccinia graminis f. sp. tritici]|uniref:Glutamyl/glutaminyl-tRNA synthetase class Ib anti-codon binding domain-containing protein n=1 Tax=Puccinia graminis f. sp. tritici TaxID=56615 RepID=A0A5B0MQZ0_PUCGR|nr:hypothetical protein PGT21_035445 [Puccinia graminis f. sp. tritici]